MRSSLVLPLAASVALVLADTHYLFSGFFSGSTVVGLEFDDAASTLTIASNITTDASSGAKWIALDAQKKNLYVATTGYFQSYAITSDLSLTYQTNVSLPSSCTNANYIVGSSAAPYPAFAAAYSSGCSGLVISVSDTGALASTVANLTYDSAAGVHGLAVSPDGAFVYSADDMGNAVWAHSFDAATGVATELQRLAAPTSANPRHLTVHPNGRWVYVIFEEASELAVYSRNATTGALAYTNTTYNLLPSGYTNTSSYWADEVAVSNASSVAPKYLITGTRSRTTGAPGYVSAFALDAETGAVTSQLFIQETTGSGGSANAVSPAGFSEEYFAITDSGADFVEVWRIDEDGSGAAAVAHADLQSGPANAVWYS